MTDRSEMIGGTVAIIGMCLMPFGTVTAIIAGTIHTTTSLIWGLTALLVPGLMMVLGVMFVPPGGVDD